MTRSLGVRAYELIFDSRLAVPATGTETGAQIGYELRTTGSFVTAVPEPARGWLLAVGLTGLAGWLGQRPRRAPAVARR